MLTSRVLVVESAAATNTTGLAAAESELDLVSEAVVAVDSQLLIVESEVATNASQIALLDSSAVADNANKISANCPGTLKVDGTPRIGISAIWFTCYVLCRLFALARGVPLAGSSAFAFVGESLGASSLSDASPLSSLSSSPLPAFDAGTQAPSLSFTGTYLTLQASAVPSS